MTFAGVGPEYVSTIQRRRRRAEAFHPKGQVVAMLRVLRDPAPEYGSHIDFLVSLTFRGEIEPESKAVVRKNGVMSSGVG